MKRASLLLILFFSSLGFCRAQNTTVVLDTSMVSPAYFQSINLSGFSGWVYKKGNDPNWSKPGIDTRDWKKFNFSELSGKDADKDGRFEAWLRFRFRLDSSFKNFPVGIYTRTYAATDIFIDGKYVTSFGNTGLNGKPFKEHIFKIHDFLDLKLGRNVDHILAVHIVDYRSPFNSSYLKTEITSGYASFVRLTSTGRNNVIIHQKVEYKSYYTLWSTACAVLGVLFWLLYFQNRREKNLAFIAMAVTSWAAGFSIYGIAAWNPDISFFTYRLVFLIAYFLTGTSIGLMIIILSRIFGKRVSIPLIGYSIFYAVATLGDYYFFQGAHLPLLDVSVICICLYLIISSWHRLKGAQWSVVWGTLLMFGALLMYAYNFFAAFQQWPFPHCYLYLTVVCLSFPLSLMVYVAWRFKEILDEVRSNASEVVRISEEKKEILANQNTMLEKQVDERTKELHQSLQELKSTQSQLIQSEKMASLGELTAGIAHEIQNPLNFVNNFSEVSTELLEEMREEIENGNFEEVKVISADLNQNLEKILTHGRRADGIVKGMLQHSRGSSGQKEPTDINALADEYLRLSYHGLRARDKSFTSDFKLEADETLPNVNVVPQDMGRVLLNLINNAFYAVSEKAKQNLNGYKPSVMVSTRSVTFSSGDSGMEIRVKDNGPGIPDEVKKKIFQPFFTTKPTGQGTGLGLSMSYDIVKAHGGELKVESKDGQGTEFVFQLPVV